MHRQAALPLESRSLRARRVQLYVASFLLDAVGHAFPLVVSCHAQYALGASSTELGLLGSTMTLVYAVVCFGTANWSDRIGSMPLLWAGLTFLWLVLFPALMWADSLAHFFIANAFFGCALALFWPPLQRELSFLSPGDTLWRALGAFNLSWAAGSVVGTYIGGPRAFQAWGFEGTVWILAAVALASFLSTLGRWPRPAAGRVESPLELVDQRKAMLFLYLGRSANFVAAFAMGGVHMVFPYIQAKLEVSANWATLILCAKEAARFIAFGCLRWLPGWHYSLGWLAFFHVVGGGGMLACAFVKDPFTLMALFVPLGFFSGIAYYSSIYYGLNFREAEGRKSAMHEGILAVGVVLGPAACGAAGDLFPRWPGAALAVAGAVIWGGLVFELVLVRLVRSKVVRMTSG